MYVSTISLCDAWDGTQGAVQAPSKVFLKEKKNSSSILVNFLSQIIIIPTSNLILPQFGGEDYAERRNGL